MKTCLDVGINGNQYNSEGKFLFSRTRAKNNLVLFKNDSISIHYFISDNDSSWIYLYIFGCLLYIRASQCIFLLMSNIFLLFVEYFVLRNGHRLFVDIYPLNVVFCY